jgi:hypothetical protein
MQTSSKWRGGLMQAGKFGTVLCVPIEDPFQKLLLLLLQPLDKTLLYLDLSLICGEVDSLKCLAPLFALLGANGVALARVVCLLAYDGGSHPSLVLLPLFSCEDSCAAQLWLMLLCEEVLVACLEHSHPPGLDRRTISLTLLADGLTAQC